jgi:hypothetical protein
MSIGGFDDGRRVNKRGKEGEKSVGAEPHGPHGVEA